MRRSLWITRCALVLLPVLWSGTRSVSAGPFSDLFVFGDSFSDSGNVFAGTAGLVPADPPYFQGRFSNGPIWAEHLAERLELRLVPNGADPQVVQGNNFAVGGSLTAEDVLVGFVTLPSVVSQVEFFASALNEVPSDALYAILGGHADLRVAADPAEGLDPPARRAVALRVIEAIETAITRLASSGATTFLIPNAVDLGRAPESRIVRRNAAELTELTLFYNAALEPALAELEASLGVRIIRPDLFALGERIVEDALQNDGAVYGITNIDLPILAGLAGSPGAPPETSLFFDDLHISAVGHEILGDFAFEAVEAAFSGGGQRPGDCNQDGKFDISDPICLLGFLFVGNPASLPCGDGTVSHEGNVALADFNGDGAVNLSDPVGALSYLFAGNGVPHALGTECVRIVGCEDACEGEQ